jgi:mono/diheme cytochrome c family protein
MVRRMKTVICRLVVVSALLAAPSAVLASDPAPFLDYNGAQLFQRFCASCHGPQGYGDGPVAPSLKVLIPDLTELSKRAGGRFPTDRVHEIIDGRAVLTAHGTRPMPVWGYELEAQVPPDQSGREVAQGLIDRLVEHLRSIQR